MKIKTDSYRQQSECWPNAGRVILAQYDDESVTVYQAYRPEIGHFAARHGYFGGQFKLTRMSWIKPNFLWMMYRSGWGLKEGQEVTLAIHLCRKAFDEILNQAVHSSYKPEIYGTRTNWQQAVQASDVRLQWDPDHAPDGANLERRAIQLGLRGELLQRYAREWIIGITDISQFVAQQREHATPSRYENLRTPRERPYPISNAETRARLQTDHS